MLATRRARYSGYLSWLLVGAIGAVEGIYGRTQYLGDWISYLNVSRAVSVLDWRGIFDPMWSPGYPVLVALARGVFPHTAEGEWHAITLLNWLIYLAAFASWRYLIREASEFYALLSAQPERRLDDDPAAIWITCCAFLSCTLCLDRVSSVAPDLLITTLFLLSVGTGAFTSDTTCCEPRGDPGADFGAGCWAKGVFVLRRDPAFYAVFCCSQKADLQPNIAGRSVGVAPCVCPLRGGNFLV